MKDHSINVAHSQNYIQKERVQLHASVIVDAQHISPMGQRGLDVFTIKLIISDF